MHYTRDELVAALRASQGKAAEPNALDRFQTKARIHLKRSKPWQLTPKTWLALGFLGFCLGVIALDRAVSFLF